MAKTKLSDDLFFNEEEIKNAFDFGGESNTPSEKEIEIIKSSNGTEVELDVDSLVQYRNHTFLVRDNEDMEALVSSIKDYGIILPLLVRKLGGGKYEVISGHRRLYASKKIGLKKVPCKVVELDDAMADIQMVDTNLSRSDKNILPSEKARSYRLRKEAAIKKGKETKETKSPVELISEQTGENKRQVERYIRLTYLTNYLLDAVDKGFISTAAGVSLSFLSIPHQKNIENMMKDYRIKKISIKEAEKLRNNESRGLSEEQITELLFGKTPAPVKKKVSEKFSIKLFLDVLPDNIRSASMDNQIRYIRNAIKEYNKK